MRWLLRALILGAGIAAATTAAAGEIWVHFVTPEEGSAVIGEIQVEAEVLSAKEVRDVVFYLDGRPVGMLTAAPYRLRIDLGEENRAHTFEVIATNIDGDEVRRRITTQPAAIGGRYEVELQQLYVTATSDEGRVLDLEREDFEILDEGRRQEVVTFARGDIPFTAALLIDASASMYGSKLEAARAGATAFINGMHELDQGKVIVFSDVIQNSTPFSGVREVLTAGLTGAIGEGGTAINDHLFSALKLLEVRQGRRVVVLLSDGIDTHSALSMRQIREHARRSQALIYWIRLLRVGDPEETEEIHWSSAWRLTEEYRDQIDLMSQLVEASGGRTVIARDAGDIEPIFVEILRELREQYALGYYPDNRANDGRWHRVRVRIARPEVEVRTHEGYVDLGS
jgi:VWFA-related protein